MELSPSLYSHFVRSQWLTKFFIHNLLTSEFQFSDKKVLDFGSGTGSNCLLFKPSYYLGADVDPNRVNYARNRYPNYKFIVLQDNQLPIESESLNYVLIVAVLHHIPTEHLMIYLKEIHRVLKPDGKVIVIEPCFFEIHEFNNKFMRRFDNGKFIRNEKQYLSLFNQVKFNPEVKKKFKKIFYNEIFFSAGKI